MMIPMILRLKVKSDDASFGFFFPMPLLYILMIPAFIIAGIVYAFMMLSPELTKQPRSFMMIFFKTPTLLSAASGIKIDVHSNDADIKMYLK